METQLTVRLPADLSSKVYEKAKKLKLKRSDVVRLALAEFLEGPFEVSSPYEEVKHLLGSVPTGIKDLGERHRDHLIRKFRKNV